MQFREATAADRERILALRTRCFGDVDPEKADPRFWDWEFSRARMFVGERDGTTATHLAMLDWPYFLDGKLVPGALAVDAMTDPNARGQGAFTGVVRHALAQHEHEIATAYQIRKEVLGAMLRAGWSVAEKVPVLLRPALTLRKKLRAPLLQREAAGWMSDLAPREACIARTPEFLRWRFFDNPRWQYRVSGILDSAYVVTRRTRLKGFDTLAIADLAFRDAHWGKLLLRDAITHARNERCTLLAAFVSRNHPAFGMLLRAGFVPGPHWFRLLVHPREQASRKWQVMWGDTDHL